jgi:hypothetical protein
MATSLSQCAKFLAREGVRHHVDVAEGAIRVVLVTRRYRNLRAERLLIIRIETPDDGCRCRVSVPRAFAVGSDPAARLSTLCGLAAETPLVGVEHDPGTADVRLVAEMPVEDARLTQLQLLTLIDRVTAAAESWHASLATGSGRRPRSGPRSRDAA